MAECVICLEPVSINDSYYVCKICNVMGHMNCYNRWWNRANNKRIKCCHCQQKSSLVKHELDDEIVCNPRCCCCCWLNR